MALFVSNCKSDSNTAPRQIFIWTKYGGTKNSALVESLNRHGGKNSHLGVSLEISEPVIYNIDFLKNDSINFLHKMDKNKFDDNTHTTEVYTIYLNAQEFKRFQNKLNEILKKQITYDFNFNLQNDDVYYCSEFIYELLKAANKTRFKYEPQQTILKGVSKLILQREELIYIPADFFLSYEQLTKISPNIETQPTTLE